MSSHEGPSTQPKVNTSEFFFDGSGLSALLVHGLTGTPYEMRYLGERIAEQGIRVRGVRLAGHAVAPEALGPVTYDDWYESVVSGFKELRAFDDPIVIVGFSCGAVLSARLVEDQPEAIAALVMLSPAFFLPWQHTLATKAVSLLGKFSRLLYLQNTSGSDIHDRSAWLIHPTCQLMPLSAPNELLKLSAVVRPRLGDIKQPLLVMQSVNDHLCPIHKNADYVMSHIGSTHKRAVMLEQSYHIITVDYDKDRVASEVIAFLNQFRSTSQRIATA